ncbi:sulfotransferase [Moorena sp. SIO3B2]|uniref:sulfotransferase family protein n=1 Tax=Moorena sp. SIO3B2 TaxID=2607827 RepID=UPI0013C7016E|nr:sulfotransferase [Moorena sp. SIO3B2]NEP35317.1 sulfotransferase [Moorena sp. SIO3B2]
MKESNHLFVSGAPRSGTTLLQLVLSAHPQITVTPETHFIQQLFAKDFTTKQLNREQKEVAIALMRSDKKLNSWPNFNLDQFIATVSWKTDLTISQLLDSLFNFFACQNNSGTDYLGNKKGCYAKKPYTDYTQKVFPDARFIYIVRDPRDIVRSMLDNIYFVKSLEEAATICQSRGQGIWEMKENFPETVFVVRYENLILTPEKVCSQICAFLDISFDKQMLNFYELNKGGSRLLGVTKDIHPHTQTPFNPELIQQWQKQRCFTNQELETIETITSDYLNRYGYETYSSFLS